MGLHALESMPREELLVAAQSFQTHKSDIKLLEYKILSRKSFNSLDPAHDPNGYCWNYVVGGGVFSGMTDLIPGQTKSPKSITLPALAYLPLENSRFAIWSRFLQKNALDLSVSEIRVR